MSQEDLVKDHFHRMGQDGSYAAFYGARGRHTHDFFMRMDRVEEFLNGRIEAGQRVLDVGCGTGPMVDYFCSRGLHYVGLDVAQGMLDSIAQRFRNAPYREHIELRTGTSDRVPLPGASIDVYVGMGLLEYLTDMQPTFHEIARVLKPGGLAVLTIPNYLSDNRYIMRHSGFITAISQWRKKPGAESESRQEFFHKELSPGALDGFMRAVGLQGIGRAFYDYKLICYPFSRLFPEFAYAVNRRVENRAPSVLANGYIGFYGKQGSR